MFKKVTIQMTGPICTCEQQSLSWSVPRDPKTGRETLEISCDLCKTILRVSNDKFVANFQLETPYPKGRVPEAPKEIAKVLKLVQPEQTDPEPAAN